jgi:hypothetical protein
MGCAAAPDDSPDDGDAGREYRTDAPTPGLRRFSWISGESFRAPFFAHPRGVRLGPSPAAAQTRSTPSNTPAAPGRRPEIEEDGMGYRMLGRMHAALTAGRREAGQGTVEYVALILLVAIVLAGVVAATRKTSIGSGDIGKTIVEKLKAALDDVK